LQNTSNGTVASTDYIVSNDVGKSNSFYGDFGINSSQFAGTGALNAANSVYLYSAGSDLAIGTANANAIHFVINSNATDAMTINSSNAVAFNGSYGTAGQVLESNGSGAAPTWVTFSGGATLGNASANAVYYPTFANATTGTFTAANVSPSLNYNPALGDLSSPQFIASNGLIENSNTVSTTYAVAAGRNAMSVGPLTFASGVTVTIPAASRWVIL